MSIHSRAAAGLLLVLTGAACSRGPAADPNAYANFVRGLIDPDRPARLDTPQTELLDTYDRTNGNNDFNNFAGREGEDWAVLADLEGPGVITRFWTTGGANAEQRFRFYFDGEREPRLEGTVAEFRRGAPPFIPELSRYEQSGWYSYAPLPFQKRVRVLAKHSNFTHEGWPRLFFQMNYSRLLAAPSLPAALAAADVDALQAFGAALAAGGGGGDATNVVEAAQRVEPGAAATVLRVPGPAVIRRLELEVEAANADLAAEDRAGLFLRLAWDGDDAAASVAVPVDPFFGKLWASPDYGSAYLETRGALAVCRLPMPVKTAAAITVENRGARAVALRMRARVDPLPAWREELGFLHAEWHRSGPEQRGQPHPVLRAQGRGKVAGCMLAVCSAEPSWWVLEGDERIQADAEEFPGWHGTGLEDYFNGAWYYKNNLVRPLHGLVLKRPFTTVQYRFHPVDGRSFAQQADMSFERGPDQASAAWFESVGYWYQATPAAAQPDAWTPAAGGPPADPFAEAALMGTLANYERFGDYAGARRCLDRFLATHDSPDAEVLKLRRIAYQERLEGMAAARPAYEAFMRSASNEAALAYARLLLWFHEDPAHALLSLHCGNPTRAYLDEVAVAETTRPQAFIVAPVTLKAGKHVLALHAFRAAYPEWVQAGLRTHQGIIGTDPQWPYAFDPAGNWRSLDYDTSAWGVPGDSIREGPPPAPHVGVSPHPFVDLHAQPWGVWVGAVWPEGGKTAVFRKTFDTP